MANDETETSIVPLTETTVRVSPRSILEALAVIPEEDIWLAKQKSPRTRRAYLCDVQNFLRFIQLRSTAELRSVDHRAVIAWERHQREVDRAAGSTVCRRLAVSGHLDPSTTKLYDRRGYNPERSASFYANY